MLDYTELVSSQIPALHVLTGLGWQYLPPKAVAALRSHRRAVVLENVLADWLRTHNRIPYKGRNLSFSEANIAEAVRQIRITDDTHAGLLPASADAYELLTLGISLEQAIDGDRRSFSLRYIDWQYPENNVYHVTDEFSVERRGSKQTYRPDLVLFVNGIPLAVIECKSTIIDDPLGEAISQMLRNQQPDGIPHLFTLAQLLVVAEPNGVRYGTTGTTKDYYAVWKEDLDAGAVSDLINRSLSDAEKTDLYDWRDDGWKPRQHFDQIGERQPNAQDCALIALFQLPRFLELVYQYIVYDAGIKKVARYQQYFAIQATIDRVRAINAQGSRTGGMIWHTTGSGKSLTMVMLAKALALNPQIANPRIVIVTDRIDLDDQIWRTFKACGKSVQKANSGRHLIDLVRSPANEIITTVIDKFEAAAREKVSDPGVNVFVLVDEGHRGQYGQNHALMRRVLPNACYLGFTGTPLLAKDKTTAERFGGFIHTYTMRQAVADQAVVPLIYDGRLVDLEVSDLALDTWFERRTRDLTESQKADLKKKMSRAEEVNRTGRRLTTVAFDIAEHYKKNFRGTGMKAQLATASKVVALQYYRLLTDEGIACAVIISAPDTREGSADIDEESLAPVQAFWRQMMQTYGGEEAYNRAILSRFHQADELELLIVVDKLLVGFDEPRNTVLYIDKPLKEHGLLQAIARVNRVFPGKDVGYIVDYRGVLGKLDEAMQTYAALEGFSGVDVADTVIDIRQVMRDLPTVHSDLWAVFKDCPNRSDSEAMEQFLAPEDLRHTFYEALTAYAKTLKVALSEAEFYDIASEKQIARYKRDLVMFHNLRAAVRQRYAESIDYSDYEEKIRKLIGEHVQATGVIQLVSNLNIFDEEQFAAEMARLAGRPVAEADTIANQIKRVITEHADEDPAFYRRLSQMIDETIQLYRASRISEIDYLNQMRATQTTLMDGMADDTPTQLRGSRDARAYYGVIQQITESHEINPDTLADLALAFEQTIERHKIRDWVGNHDVESRIQRALDDVLYSQNKACGWQLTQSEQATILDGIIDVARRRDALP